MTTRKERMKVTAITGQAIRRGDLVRQPCENCGLPPENREFTVGSRTYFVQQVEAHHDSYDYPLEVRWLCKRHHLEHHQTWRRLRKVLIA